MFLPLLLYSTIALTIGWCLFQLKLAFAGPLSSVPGPWHTRFTRLFLKIKVLKGDRMYYTDALHKAYGPIVRLGPTEVSISDVEEVKNVYKVASPYLKDARFYELLAGQKLKALFTYTDPKQHAAHRRLGAASFSDNWIHKMEPGVKNTVRLAISKMDKDMKENGYFDAFYWFLCMATDSLGEGAFGSSFDTLHNKKGSMDQYLKDIQLTSYYGTLRTESEFFQPLLNVFSKYWTQNVQNNTTRSLQYSEQSVERYWKMYNADPENVVPTLLTKEYDAVVDGRLSMEQVRRDGVSSIVAGTDTTANTCVQIVWQVSQHPDVHARLAQECSNLPHNFNDDDLRKIPYIQWVIDETLRLRGPASEHLPRVVPSGGARISGQYLPEGTILSMQAYTLHRNEKAFPDPLRFDPSRWETVTAEMRQSFMPFGGGSRICIGMHFAQMEIRHAVANFYRTFTTPLAPANVDGFTVDDMKLKGYFIATPKGGRCLLREATA